MEKREALEHRASELFSAKYISQDWRKVVIAAIFVIGIAGAYLHPTAFIAGHDNQINQGTINLYNASGKPVRQWSDLSFDERMTIKDEIREKFPNVANGEDRDFRPVLKWMIDERNVTSPSPRDLFRNR